MQKIMFMEHNRFSEREVEINKILEEGWDIIEGPCTLTATTFYIKFGKYGKYEDLK